MSSNLRFPCFAATPTGGLVVVAFLVAGCGSSSSDAKQASALDSDAGARTIGERCIPSVEANPSFPGFVTGEISLEEQGAQHSGEPVCLTYHFQGRSTCPYGQDATGTPPTGASACTTPEGAPVEGEVRAQCTDRSPADTIYWSCRCANADGQTNDGDTYCACPSGFACNQIIADIGGPGSGVSGAYCIKDGTDYDPSNVCSTTCDPNANPCP